MVDRMYCPGANTSTELAPQSENEARPSTLVDAPTEITLSSGLLAGQCGVRALSCPSLPAAVTNSTPASCALVMAACKAGSLAVEPHEALTMRAPWAAA